MNFIKRTLLATLLSALLFISGTSEISFANETAASNVTGSMPARNVATSAEDMTLTNQCIESGKEKIYCLCVTKIFKNEMTLRDYRGAVSLYSASDMAARKLGKKGYTAQDISSIKALTKELRSEDQFRTRCHAAEIYFASATEG